MKKLLLILSVLFVSFPLFSQLRTGYFVSSYTLGHHINPAFVPNQGYVGIPVLSNIGVEVNSNIGAANVLYPLENGRVGLFLHPEIRNEEFIGKLPVMSYIDAVASIDVINVGWFTGKSSFWSLDAGVNVVAGSSLPKELFRFFKEGMGGSSAEFNMNDLGISGDVYAYVSLGYSAGLDNLLEGLRIGGKVKFLAGMVNFYAKYENLHISLNSDRWNVIGNGSGRILGGGAELTYDPSTGVVNGVEFDPSELGVSGVGGAIDFGVQYRIAENCLLDGLRFSAAVTDLGFISYFKDKSTLVESDGFVEYDGFDGIIEGSAGLEDQLDELLDRAMTIVSFKHKDVNDDQITMLTTKVSAGIDYSFLEDKMNIGVLYTGALSKIRTRHELMASFNYAPVSWFDISVSYSFMNTRSSIGWLLAFTPKKGLNLFLGSDYTSFRYTPQGIPVDKAFLGVNIGVSVPIGERR